MTQTEWLSSSDPVSLLRWLTGTPGSSPEGASGALAPARRPSERKLRLFACAVSRIVGLVPDEPIDATEAWADGGGPKPKGRWVILDDDCAEGAARFGFGARFGPTVDRQAQKAAILRDIVGDPFAPVTLPSARTLCPDCPSGAPEEDCDDCAGDGFVWADAARDNCCRRCYGYGTVVSGAGGQSVGMEPRKTCPACRGHGLQRHPWITPEVLSLATAAYEERGNPCPVSFRHPPHDYCDGSPSGERTSDGTLDPFRLVLVADALEEAGCPTGGELAIKKVTAGHECPVCGGRGYWRSGVHFDHQMKCSRCDARAWDPGEDYVYQEKTPPHPVLANLRSPGPHYRGMWSLDLVLGKE